uniref:Uncharacterized protein n=1 Tax=Oryza punctata TaxID=4537 RepID=A0A0E0KKM6_ORYPU
MAGRSEIFRILMEELKKAAKNNADTIVRKINGGWEPQPGDKPPTTIHLPDEEIPPHLEFVIPQILPHLGDGDGDGDGGCGFFGTILDESELSSSNAPPPIYTVVGIDNVTSSATSNPSYGDGAGCIGLHDIPYAYTDFEVVDKSSVSNTPTPSTANIRFRPPPCLPVDTSLSARNAVALPHRSASQRTREMGCTWASNGPAHVSVLPLEPFQAARLGLGERAAARVRAERAARTCSTGCANPSAVCDLRDSALLLSGMRAWAAVSREIRKILTERASNFNIALDDVSITSLSSGKEFTHAIEAKQGEAKSAQLIGEAIDNNPAFLALRQIEAAREISNTMASSSNKVYGCKEMK